MACRSRGWLVDFELRVALSIAVGYFGLISAGPGRGGPDVLRSWPAEEPSTDAERRPHQVVLEDEHRDAGVRRGVVKAAGLRRAARRSGDNAGTTVSLAHAVGRLVDPRSGERVIDVQDPLGGVMRSASGNSTMSGSLRSLGSVVGVCTTGAPEGRGG